MDGLTLKRKWRAGEPSAGMWLRLTDPTVVDMVGDFGFDWVIFDAEQIAYDLQPLQALIMGFKGTGTLPLVRVYDNDAAYIKKVLDMGAAGVLVPQISSAREAEAAIAACKYPPAGIRGTGPRRPSRYGSQYTEYVASANEQTIVMIMFEMASALKEIDKIMALQGLDGIIIGPADLSMTLGLNGDASHPKAVEAINTIVAKANAAGMPFGTGRPMDDQFEWARRGARILAMGDDEMFIQQGALRSLAEFKQKLLPKE
jgi:2-keto-3-deoxy-L-rhamnonate aldolase RhmA